MTFLNMLFSESLDDSIERLAEYYANGEISKREFERAKKLLTRETFKELISSCNSVRLSNQTFVAQKNMRKDGRITGYAPIGYSNITYVNGESDVVPDEKVASYIKTLFLLYSTGRYKIQQIVQFAHQFGLIGKKSQKPLTRQAVIYILNNPFYCGIARHYGDLYDHQYESLIDIELFVKCQRLLFCRGIIKYSPFITLEEAA